ncbi:MAG: hypothetical protein HN742_30705 [Lentisphaerae bacterium]|nr:hypothetical protein [Lentisphaerota bacterium]MBT4820474.1 hypothetical protein [Lentisphaerota bacterium]MBT5606324.1 hypothetical protein [Lentisphaerota bacterium]MBT7059604.1 hypothetical protein [Lentisphaerota bacterium]MBT7846282.1 hypothetical protein [Lentisphaerota bacterium]
MHLRTTCKSVSEPLLTFRATVLTVALSVTFGLPGVATSQITIAHKGTANATLLYQGRPLFKVGPMPEQHTFAYTWDSTFFDHRKWTDWMLSHRLAAGRVYPTCSYRGHPPYGDFAPQANGWICPFKIDHWENEHPVVDLDHFNPAYWSEMADTIKKCRERDIVLILQLYQWHDFNSWIGENWWQYNFYHPANNVNEFRIASGVNVFGKIAADFPNGPLWEIHERWVLNVLDAIGDNGNVILGIINEGSVDRNGVPKKWVDKTLDIIELWESRNDINIPVSMLPHMWDSDKPSNKGWVLAHPQLEVMSSLRDYCYEPGRAAQLRRKHKKPVVIICYNDGDGPSNPADLTADGGRNSEKCIYQWLGLITKSQVMGLYGKWAHDTDLSHRNAQEYGKQSKRIMEFFDTIGDYVSLEVKPESISRVPSGNVRQKHLLTSSGEAVVYLATCSNEVKNYGETIDAGTLELINLKMKDGEVSVRVLHPASGAESSFTGNLHRGSLTISLPSFHEHLAIHITPRKG